jgi:UrcA family protein
MNHAQLIRSAAAILATVAAGAAAAEPILVTHVSGKPTVKVPVTQADFASAYARRKLDIRLGDAIEQVCGAYSTAEIPDWPLLDLCWGNARTQVRTQLDALPFRAGLTRP